MNGKRFFHEFFSFSVTITEISKFLSETYNNIFLQNTCHIVKRHIPN